MAHKWTKECCPKTEKYYRNEYGALVEKEKSGARPTSDFHKENQATMIAMREAVKNGDVDRLIDLKFKKEFT